MDYRKARNAYSIQKSGCKKRKDVNGNPIEMRLSFEEWADIWLESGKWEQRGNTKGCYCMARFNDIGHYEKGNVAIVPFGDNVAEHATGKSYGKGYRHTEEAKRKIAEAGKRPCSEETKEKIRQANTGAVCSDETKAKLSAMWKGKPKKRVNCEFCGMETSPQNLSRHHKVCKEK